jgi:replicative DNA helicase
VPQLASVPASSNAPVPPQNLEAEESVLGAMMLAPGAIGAVSEVLAASDFYRESHGTIYRAAIDLYSHGEPVDAITLADKLEERRELEQVGGRSRVHELAALVPATANAGHYARIVRDMSMLRGLIAAGGEIQRLGWDRPGDIPDLIGQAEAALYSLTEPRAESRLALFKDTLLETFARINELYESGAEITGIPSGFKELDQLTAGFQPANLIVLAARPSMGKSALCLSVLANVAKAGLPAAFFSLEMSRQEIAQRLICMEGKIDSHSVRTGKLGQEDWTRLATACGTLESVPLYIDDTPGLSLLELRSHMQTLKRREPDLCLVVVDYLQLMTEGTASESRLQEVSAISRGLKSIAKDFDVPVLALSQLSRAPEQRHDKRPILSDLRESGSIEQDADLVMFIYRDEYYNSDSEDQGMAEISVAKHRNGPTDTIKLAFLKRYAKFSSVHG